MRIYDVQEIAAIFHAEYFLQKRSKNFTARTRSAGFYELLTLPVSVLSYAQI